MSRTAATTFPRQVREVEAGLDVPLYAHADWAARWDWLIQGTTWRGPDGDFDLGLSGAQPVGAVLDRWRALRRMLGAEAVVHSRQVHAARIQIHDRAGEGITILDGFDGHFTRAPCLLLTVSVADCVPVSIVDPVSRAVTLLHAGWRGLAAGIVESGIRLAAQAAGGDAARLHVHFGPAICGLCYEVGPEVHESLGLPVPESNRPVDLRLIGAERARAEGVSPAAITISAICTRCQADRPFFSHRAGEKGRQMGLLGIRHS